MSKVNVAVVGLIGILAGYVVEQAIVTPDPEGDVADLGVPGEVVTFRGQVQQGLLGQNPMPGQLQPVLVMTAADVPRCEDLGRQLRVFLGDRSSGNLKALEVLVPADEDIESVRNFLRLERLPHASIGQAPRLDVLGSEEIPTPALLVVDAQGRFRGAAYAASVRFVRAGAFDEWLPRDSLKAWAGLVGPW